MNTARMLRAFVLGLVILVVIGTPLLIAVYFKHNATVKNGVIMHRSYP